jgi:rod shape-determining protein MreC
LIPILLIDSSSRSDKEFRFVDRIVVNLTSPIQSVLSWSLEKIVIGLQKYVFLFKTYQTNLILIDQNRKLLKEISQLKESAQENARLKNLLRFKEESHLEAIAASVIAKDFLSDFRIVRISRGSKAGIQRNMAVVSQEGVIGRVLRTTESTSDVVTILDLLSAVDVIAERSRSHGVLEGFTESSCQLKYLLRTDEIQVGDILITSGLGGIFPKGLKVGTVSFVDRKPYGISQEVQVRPIVDFDRLEEVLVLLVGDLE